MIIIFSLLIVAVSDILIVDAENDLNMFQDSSAKDESSSCCVQRKTRPVDHLHGSAEPAALSTEIDYNEYAGSFKIYAVKG